MLGYWPWSQTHQVRISMVQYRRSKMSSGCTKSMLWTHTGNDCPRAGTVDVAGPAVPRRGRAPIAPGGTHRTIVDSGRQPGNVTGFTSIDKCYQRACITLLCKLYKPARGPDQRCSTNVPASSGKRLSCPCPVTEFVFFKSTGTSGLQKRHSYVILTAGVPRSGQGPWPARAR